MSLAEPEAPMRSLTRRLAEVESAQLRVLDSLDPSEFRLTVRWDTISAFAGEVTAEGLTQLLASPEVLRVDLDPEVRIHL